MKAIELAPHEFAANYIFANDDLMPYFAASRAVRNAGGSNQVAFRTGGEKWVARLYYQDSGIVHPGGTLPTGTEFRPETVREFRIAVNRCSDEDPVGQQSLNAHIAPRWPGMKAERADGTVTEIEYPDKLGEAVNVRVKGSNIAFERYLHLLQRAAGALGIRRKYFTGPHEYSNIQDAELYARVHTDASGPVHARDGPIASMGHLLENDRQGYRKVVQDDDDDHGENLPGYYHTVTLGPRRVREAFPSHELPVEVKHYYAKEAADFPDDHPLAHPKVGASYQASKWDDTLGVTDDDLGQLREELARVVYSVLADAGLDLAPSEGDGGGGGPGDRGPFVEDAYFDPEVGEQPVEPVSLEFTRVRQEQESVVVRHVADGLSPVQWESLETLITDGGEVAPVDIADEHGRHVDSVRRALREMEELVDREYGQVALASEYVAEMVHDAVSEAREAVRTATETTAKALEAAERGLEEGMASFVAWAARHGVDVDGAREAQLTLRFGETDRRERGRAIREGFRIWKESGLDPAHYRQAQVRFADGSKSTAWRWLTG